MNSYSYTEVSMEKLYDFNWWFEKFCNMPSRFARIVVLNRREHAPAKVRAAIAALREWKK